MNKVVFSVPEAASYYGVSKSHIYKLCHYRKVAFSKPKNGSRVFFKKEDLDEYFLGNRYEPTEAVDLEIQAAEYMFSK